MVDPLLIFQNINHKLVKNKIHINPPKIYQFKQEGTLKKE